MTRFKVLCYRLARFVKGSGLTVRSALTPRISIALAALVAILMMAPFGVALSVHHQLAAADHDGHQHSDFDLCQWVQYHGTSAPALALLDVGQLYQPMSHEVELATWLLISGDPLAEHSPRGPPLV